MLRSCHSLAFVMTGLAWLVVSMVLGMSMFLADTYGMGLPTALRSIHLHGALIGGVLQLVMGLWLTPMAAERPLSPSRPGLYMVVNGGTLGMLLGFWLEQPYVIGGSGFFVLVAALALIPRVPDHASLGLTPGLTRWWYGVALIALLAGLLTGAAMAWNVVPQERLRWMAMAHGLVTVIGFVLLSVLGLVHWLVSRLWERRWSGMSMLRVGYVLLPLGALLVLFGVLDDRWWLQMGGGLVMSLGTGLYAFAFVRTVRAMPRPRPRAMAHLVMGVGYLCAVALCGLLQTVNVRWMPPPVRIGQLHLLAYTHMFYLGVLVQSLFGLLAEYLPFVFAKMRLRSHKKQKPFHARLVQVLDRGHAVQIWSFNLGLLALVGVAALVWWVPLKSPSIPIGALVSSVLLLIPCALFAAKVALVAKASPEP